MENCSVYLEKNQDDNQTEITPKVKSTVEHQKDVDDETTVKQLYKNSQIKRDYRITCT